MHFNSILSILKVIRKVQIEPQKQKRHCGAHTQGTSIKEWNQILFNMYKHIKMCACVFTYIDTHREKGCSFIELALNLEATTRGKKKKKPVF